MVILPSASRANARAFSIKIAMGFALVAVLARTKAYALSIRLKRTRY